jgi:hypothetical protein
MGEPMRFVIELPPHVDPAENQRLIAEVKAIQGVNAAGDASERSIDAASIGMWVQLAGTVITTAGAAVPVVQKIVELFRKRQIEGVKVKLADGTVIDADRIGADDLKALVTKSTD